MKILSINLSILKNGLNKKFSSVFIHKSNLTLSFLNVLYKEGVIRSYNILSENQIEVFLKYYKGVSILKNIKLISTSSRFIYYSIEDISYWKNKYLSSNSFLVLNTSQKVFSSNELNKYKIGGQVLCIIN
jgi:ribosomal protein S8